jgi:hypothetical protein
MFRIDIINDWRPTVTPLLEALDLNLLRLSAALHETGSVSVGILVLLVAASFYSRMLSVAGVPVAIAELVRDAGLGPYGFLLLYVGIVLFAAITLYLALNSVWLLVRGRVDELNRYYGPQTLEEEIESEAGDVLKEVAHSAPGAKA